VLLNRHCSRRDSVDSRDHSSPKSGGLPNRSPASFPRGSRRLVMSITPQRRGSRGPGGRIVTSRLMRS
jgi:hypothetical protein